MVKNIELIYKKTYIELILHVGFNDSITIEVKKVYTRPCIILHIRSVNIIYNIWIFLLCVSASKVFFIQNTFRTDLR
jgi:hypothetical protein